MQNISGIVGTRKKKLLSIKNVGKNPYQEDALSSIKSLGKYFYIYDTLS